MLQVSSTTRNTGEGMNRFLDNGFAIRLAGIWGRDLGAVEVLESPGARAAASVHFYVIEWDRVTLYKHEPLPRGWRLGGVAYEFGDQVYDQPNRTMASYAEGMMVKGKHRGMKKEMRSEECRGLHANDVASGTCGCLFDFFQPLRSRCSSTNGRRKFLETKQLSYGLQEPREFNNYRSPFLGLSLEVRASVACASRMVQKSLIL